MQINDKFWHKAWIRSLLPWLYHQAYDDVIQLIDIAIWQHPDDRQKQKQQINRDCEELARALGWRKISENEKRKWINEFSWHLRGFRKIGAPFGNTNRGMKRNRKYGIPRTNFQLWKTVRKRIIESDWQILWAWAHGRFLAPPLNALNEARTAINKEIHHVDN